MLLINRIPRSCYFLLSPMSCFTKVFRSSDPFPLCTSPLSLDWRTWVLEGRKAELAVLDTALLAQKLKSGELLVFPPNFYSPNNTAKSKSTLREFILITLSHVERRPLVPAEISLRLQEIFVCISIVVSKESHGAKGFHYHVGLQSKDASKNTCTKLIRQAFSEFSGSQCNVKFHKGWGTLIGYITKEDKSPYVWGIYSLSEILSIGVSSRTKKKTSVKATEVILDCFRQSDEWLGIYESPEVRERLVYGSYSNLKQVYEDLRILKEIELSSFEKITEYLKGREKDGVKIEEYSPEELGEKYILLDWIASNLAFPRPIKTKQLYLYGAPSTQKTLILHFLSKVVRIYFASSRFNDFAGADDFYDLWVYDEFHQPDASCSSFGPSDSSVSASNTLLKVFDGQECRLDAKYSRMLRKRKNVPIIIVSNSIASSARHPGPFQARFLRLRFFTNLCNISEDRLIATLRGCILRRLGWESLPRKSLELPKFPLSYNSKRINVSLDSILKSSEAHPLFARTSRGEPVILELHRSVSPDALDDYSYLRIKVFPSCLLEGELSFLRFCLIPLANRPNRCDSSPVLKSFPVFFSSRIGGNFTLFRGHSPSFCDYLIWPIRASFQDAERSWSGELVLLPPDSFSQSDFPPHLPEESLKSASSFLELTFGPVSSSSSHFFLSSDWDKGLWNELD